MDLTEALSRASERKNAALITLRRDGRAKTANMRRDELVSVYQAVTGTDHPDWDEFRNAMVAKGRLVARVTPISATGQIN